MYTRRSHLVYDRAMKIIVITPPEAVPAELATIQEFFQSGLQILHLRKPEYSQTEMAALLEGIEPRYYDRIMLHSHYALVEKYGLRGAHYPAALRGGKPERKSCLTSTSCHSIKELERLETTYDYCFLSPVFDSVSKPGYRSAINTQELSDCVAGCGQRVAALGGITPETIRLLPGNCWGVAVLGAVWCHREPARRIESFKKLQRAV